MSQLAPLRRPRRRVGWLVVVVVVVSVVALVRIFVVSWYPVVSDSMAPTLSRGDVVVVDKVAWRLRGLERGDIVTFTVPGSGDLLVKRVEGLPGDTIVIEDAVLRVNGAAVPEPFVDHRRIDGLYFGPVVVPRDHVFLLGDNRLGSIDSRAYGAVPTGAVTGRYLWSIG